MLKKTKTYRYLFEPTVNLYYNNEVKSILYSLNILNVYLGDKSSKESNAEDGIFYILVKTDSNFEDKMLKLKQITKYYLGSYTVGTRDDNLAIIMFKSMGGKSLSNFINSKYSEMYSEHLLDSDKDKFIIYDTVSKKIGLSKEYHVLKHSQEYYQTLVKELELEEDLANELWNNEFESKVKVNEELFDINLLYQKELKE
jgi:hypothetical protein